MKRIAIFASGSGSNAQHLTEYFRKTGTAEVSAIYCNNPKAYVIERAAKLNVPLVLFSRNDFNSPDSILKDLKSRQIDLIVLAGFLWLIPAAILKEFDHRIINIHPALLPKYGGKGMYGSAVHEAVVGNKEKESGITIHLIDEVYDRGNILLQAKCAVTNEDTPESLAQKVHLLEYEFFPKVIEEYLGTL